MKRKALNQFVKICLVLGMLAGAGLLLFLYAEIWPVVFEFFAREGKPHLFAALAMAIGTLCVVGAEYIAFELMRMMRTLDGDPFVVRNVRALRRMGLVALGIALMGLSTLLLHPVPLAVIAALPVAMCGLFSLVLANVFEQAVAYKQENDLTV